MENPIKMDDLGVPLFLETPIYLINPHFKVSLGKGFIASIVSTTFAPSTLVGASHRGTCTAGTPAGCGATCFFGEVRGFSSESSVMNMIRTWNGRNDEVFNLKVIECFWVQATDLNGDLLSFWVGDHDLQDAMGFRKPSCKFGGFLARTVEVYQQEIQVKIYVCIYIYTYSSEHQTKKAWME